MGFLSKLFGFNKEEKQPVVVDPIEHNGYLIYPEPISEGGQFRIAGRICKTIDGEIKTHTFIRSDLLGSKQDAEAFMLDKARMFIDQNGDRMFK